MDSILKIENVSKSYTGHKALDDVSLEVPRGAVYGLLGPNGAGKTTLIRVITRITIADSGRVLLDGKPLTADDVFKIGYMPEERGLYKKMRVGEQALFFARLKGLTKQEAEHRLRRWFERLSIADCANVSCTEQQEAAVSAVSRDVASIGGDEGDTIAGMLHLNPDFKVINAAEYVM